MLRCKEHSQGDIVSRLMSLFKLDPDCINYIILVLWQHVLLCESFKQQNTGRTYAVGNLSNIYRHIYKYNFIYTHKNSKSQVEPHWVPLEYI